MKQRDPSPTQEDMHPATAALAPFRRLQWPALLVGAIGVVAALFGAFFSWDEFWPSYLLAYSFWLEIALGCLGLLMVHHLVGGRWSTLICRLLEAGAMTLPLLTVLFIPLLFGLTTLYAWASPEQVQESQALQQKSLYLNVPFFMIRAALYFVVWNGLAYLLTRWSLEHDRTGAERLAPRMRRLSAVGLMLYILTATLAAYDWLMSLEPEWYSSIFGLLLIAGQALAALALAIIGLRLMARRFPAVTGWTQAFNDLGNLTLAFVMIWAYFSYSQFLIIWSVDLQEETIWYYHRMQGDWNQFGIFLIALHFGIPFFLLLWRGIKRNALLLTALAVLMLAARWADLYWLIMPAFWPSGLHLHWLDLALFVAVGGGWTARFIRHWTANSPIPQHDPRLGGTHERPAEVSPAEQGA